MENENHWVPGITVDGEDSIPNKTQYLQGIHKKGRLLRYSAC